MAAGDGSARAPVSSARCALTRMRSTCASGVMAPAASIRASASRASIHAARALSGREGEDDRAGYGWDMVGKESLMSAGTKF